MRHIILGTAGHIDHGKSALVKALTGTDPDRLKEEKERGITIDIGFADIRFADEDLTVGIVDVPGHEKLISNMLAGAGGIDIVLMVIAADEGIMPQSREHLAICNLLTIKSGIIVLTKTDLAEKEWLDLVADEVRGFVRGTFLENAPLVPVSAKTGFNLELLKEEIKTLALRVTPKTSGGLFRLPVDRVFTLKGFGTVITGTAVSGSITVDDTLEILPKNISTRVRGLHSHGKAISEACAGQRVAVNLQSVEKMDLKRGDVAVAPSSFTPTKTIDAFLELLKEAPVLKSKNLVHFYTGTAEVVARVILYEKEELKGGESCYCQFRLQEPVISMSGDRYIIRRFSPLETLGGGEILDPSPQKRRRKDGIADLETLFTGSLEQKVALKISRAGISGISVNSVRGWINAETPAIGEALDSLEKTGEILRDDELLLHRNSFSRIEEKTRNLLTAFHKANPLKPGMPKEEVRTNLRLDAKLFNFVLPRFNNISVDKDLIRLKEFRIALSSNEEAFRSKIIDLIAKGGFQPPSKNEIADILKISQKQLSDILNILVKEKVIVRITDSLYLSASAYEELLSVLTGFFSKKSELTVAEFRDLLNTSRKYALPYLEYLDSHRITVRTGDFRKFLLKQK
jgi:selenocysteine-specific elongation factor